MTSPRVCWSEVEVLLLKEIVAQQPKSKDWDKVVQILLKKTGIKRTSIAAMEKFRSLAHKNQKLVTITAPETTFVIQSEPDDDWNEYFFQ
jgi:hypothetical protein